MKDDQPMGIGWYSMLETDTDYGESGIAAYQDGTGDGFAQSYGCNEWCTDPAYIVLTEVRGTVPNGLYTIYSPWNGAYNSNSVNSV